MFVPFLLSWYLTDFVLETLLSVKLKLVDGLPYIVQRLVFFHFLRDDLGTVPTLDQFLHRGDVDVAVVEERLQLGHIFRNKQTVHVDGIAAKRAGLGFEVEGEKFQRLSLGFLGGYLRFLHAFDQARMAMMFLVPVVHGVEGRVALVDG